MARHIVITGGSSGLGLALAKALAARGNAVALLARNRTKLDEAAAEIRAAAPGASVSTAACDVQDGAALDKAMRTLAGAMGGIDVLVNSAGILREGRFADMPDAVHHEVMAINYFGAINAIRAALPLLKGSRQARIVNIASIAGLTGVYGYTAYCASKHALVGFTEALRYELAPQGIAVQLVCPGEFDSPMVDDVDRYRTAENRAHAQTIPKVDVDVVMREVLQAMDGDAFTVVPGRLAKLSVFAMRHFPAVSRLLGDARIRQVQRG